ncbi:MAG TPA: hypothetical protein VNM90_07095 [Haliangium sp.]|nr:hypothetical protein [Haliangium sp.]
MPGLARSFLACLVALVTLASAPMAARAQPLPEQPATRPAPPLAPPGATAPSPGATAPSLRVADASTWRIYRASRRSQALAVTIEIFLPGYGSIYGDHWQGAVIHWGVGLVGFVALTWGVAKVEFDDSSDSPLPKAAILAGIGLYAGSRIYGLFDAYHSTARYNRRLAQRLGLNPRMVLAPVPLQINGQTALGLGASWQF